MDPQTSALTLIVFLLLTFMVGLLTCTKILLNFFQGLDTGELDSKVDPDSGLPLVIHQASDIWHRQGFLESMALGRFLLDGGAVVSGSFWAHHHLFQGRGYFIASTLVSSLFIFLVAHWFMPAIAQAFATSLSKAATRIYQIYSFMGFGIAGSVLSKLHGVLLKSLGFEDRHEFLSRVYLDNFEGEGEEASEQNGLEDKEKEMIRGIFDMKDTQVKEIMTPRVDVEALEIDTPYKQVIELIKSEKFSRIPVFKDTIDSVKGILHVADLIGLQEEETREGRFHLENYIKEAYFVPRTKMIGELMHEFRLRHIHMGIVVDEYGGTFGLVTLEDILEEIVGEIHDEDELERPLLEKLDEGVFLIDPIINLYDLKKELGIGLKPDDEGIQIDTLGGFILFVNGKVPETGDVVRYKDFSFEIIEMNGQKLEKIKLVAPQPVEGGR